MPRHEQPKSLTDILDTLEVMLANDTYALMDDGTVSRGTGHLVLALRDGSRWTVAVHNVAPGQPIAVPDDAPEGEVETKLRAVEALARTIHADVDVCVAEVVAVEKRLRAAGAVADLSLNLGHGLRLEFRRVGDVYRFVVGDTLVCSLRRDQKLLVHRSLPRILDAVATALRALQPPED